MARAVVVMAALGIAGLLAVAGGGCGDAGAREEGAKSASGGAGQTESAAANDLSATATPRAAEDAAETREAEGDAKPQAAEAAREGGDSGASTVEAAPADAWPIYRGTAGLRGVSEAVIADEPGLLWRFEAEGPMKSSPVIAGGLVYAGSNDGHVYAVKLSDGTKAWAFKTQDIVEAPPTVDGDAVYVGGNDATLYKLNAATGELIWKFAAEDKIAGAANIVALADGKRVVLIGSHDTHLYCVDADAGTLIWKYQTENFVNGTATAAGGHVIFGGCDGLLHVVKLADGTPVRKIEIGSYIAGSAALVDGRAYVGHQGNEFVCAEVETGEVVWRFKDRNFPYQASPAVTGDSVLFGGQDKRMHCVNRADGKERWQVATRGQVNSSPTVVRSAGGGDASGGRVIFGSADGRVYVVDVSDGRVVWTYEIGASVSTSPAAAAGVFVIAAEDGALYAFGRKADSPRGATGDHGGKTE